MSIIPIQVTLQAANAADYRQLVHDLAGTMASGQTEKAPTQGFQEPAAQAAPAYVPPVQQPAPQPAQPVYQQQPFTQQTPAAYPTVAPTSAVPTAAPMQQQPPVQQMPASVPTSAPQYTQQQLAIAATALMEAGHNITALLQQYNVQALTQLPPERYGEFATTLRGLGASI